MSLSIGSLLLAPPLPSPASSLNTHSDILLGCIVFPVWFLSLSVRIHPVLVTMAIGETQSQYLLAASVIQPSTRIAESCFCVCFMFPSLKSDASGQGHHRTWSGLEHPLSDSFQARLLCVSVYVCVCVCPCLLWNIVQISSASVRIARGRGWWGGGAWWGNLINLVTGKFCFAEIYFGLFLEFVYLSKIFASRTNNESLLCTLGWWLCLDLACYVASTENLSENLCYEGDGRWDTGMDGRSNFFLKFWDISFLKK